MGMYGIKEKKKMIAGKMASMKVKDKEFALEISELCRIPLKKKTSASYKGMPSNPGRMILRAFRIKKRCHLSTVLFR